MATLLERFEAKISPEPNSGCWLWAGAGRGVGYGAFRVDPDPNKALDLAHRVSFRLYRGAIPDGTKVCHSCDVRCCVNPSHLFLGTQKENIQDASRKGRNKWRPDRNGKPLSGDQHPMCILSADDVAAVRASGEPHTVLADRYGVSAVQIGRIRNGQSWRT